MRRIQTIAVSLLLAAGLTACGTSNSTPKTIEGGGFPTTVKVSGAALTIPSRPRHILSLSPSSTEMLYAMGAGSQVVGVDKYSVWPSTAPRTQLTGYETSAEDYLPEHPDLVVLAFDTSHLVAQLTKLGIPTLLLAPPTTLAGAEQQMTLLGRATGHEAGAAAANAATERSIAAAVASAHRHGVGSSYYFEIDQTYYSATSKTFMGDLLSRFGLRNIADGAAKASTGYPQLSAEYVISANPDLVVLADTVCCAQTIKTFSARAGFSALKAVQRRHVLAVNDSYASEWGPHSLELFARIIAQALNAGSSTGL